MFAESLDGQAHNAHITTHALNAVFGTNRESKMTTIQYATAEQIASMDAAAERIAYQLRAAGIEVESVSGAAQQYDAAIEISAPNVTVSVGEHAMYLSITDEEGVTFGDDRQHTDIAGLIADIKAAQ